jgi:ubiquinone/menaquinone biosynthesis C-methylase UbiE
VAAAGDRGESKTRPFAGDTSIFYARYRRAYPAELIARLAEFNRGGQGRLLDLGCGTGQLLLQLAGFFGHAVGIDPERDMLREARRAATAGGVRNVEWIVGNADDLPRLEQRLGRFDLVTIGTAFHFMNPTATLHQLQRLAPGGVIAVAYNGTPMWLHPDPWAKALRSVLEARLGPLRDNDFTEDALRAAEDSMRRLDYVQVERWERSFADTIDLDFIVGHILSAVSTDQIAPAARQDFAKEVSTAISAVASAEQFVETVKVRAVIGHSDSHGQRRTTVLA